MAVVCCELRPQEGDLRIWGGESSRFRFWDTESAQKCSFIIAIQFELP